MDSKIGIKGYFCTTGVNNCVDFKIARVFFALGTVNSLRDRPGIRDFRVRDTGGFFHSFI